MEDMNIKLNQQLLIYEMIKRGIKVEVLDDEKDIIKTKYKDHYEIIYGLDSSIMPHNILKLIKDKGFVKKNLVNNSISTPTGAAFKAKNMEYIKRVFSVLSCPVTIKLALQSDPSFLCNNLKDENEINDALDKIILKYGEDTKIVIEEYCPFKEYHIFINTNGDYTISGDLGNHKEKINPDVINVCMEVLKIFPGLPYADIGFMTDDLISPLDDEKYKIISINTVPNINIYSKHKDISKYIVDMIYPETLDFKEKVMTEDNIKKL